MSVQDKTVTSQAEEYLEAIYRLENKVGSARTMDLSRELGVVPGSITNTIENLERKGFVIHEPYRGVKLTHSGRRIASGIIRKHRLAERLLTDFLHIDWTQVHDPACKLEHAITPEIIKPLEKALGHPKTCPHGNPIPTSCGGILEDETVSLVDLDVNASAVVVKITEEKTEVLKQLTELKLLPGKQIKVEQKSGPDGSLTVHVEDEVCTISEYVASIIFVTQKDVKN
jgi:DtxR family transcriptional regulator, Mn-dependent transcriptional regulator